MLGCDCAEHSITRWTPRVQANLPTLARWLPRERDELELMEDFFVPEDQLPIQALISSRCSELGLRPVEVVRRWGYKNVPKGLRRLEALFRASLARTDTLIRALPVSLEVSVDLFSRAVENT